MSLHVHDLAGCTPTPLGSYLKALGVLRLVAEQADDDARAWWRGERFCVATRLDRNALERFFLDEYKPTPILSPWNGGSGFYDAGKSDDPLRPVETSTAPRFDVLRGAIAEVRALLGGRTAKPAPGEEKEGLVRMFKARASSALRPWLEASVVLLEDKKGRAVPRYPGLLGTGGNDGNLEFTDQFLRQLALLFRLGDAHGGHSPPSRQWLQAALFAAAAHGLTGGASGRQFDPGGAGGKNAGPGFDGPSVLNPWDFVLTLEGAILFAPSVHRRASQATGAMAAPFAVERSPAGVASAASGEAGHEEQWVPIWAQPTRLEELAALIAAGRSVVGRKHASGTVDFARAVARLGVARGIGAFERYAFQRRNGNMHFAVPSGRWQVAPQPSVELIDDLERDRWLDRLREAGRDDAPASLRSAVRLCDEAILDLCRGSRGALRWQRLLVALAEIESALVRSPRSTADRGLRPIPPLSSGWVRPADDGNPELRLALALASQHAAWDPKPTHPVREHWVPIADDPRRFDTNAAGLAIGPEVVCAGLDLQRDCIALVRRRVLRIRHDAGRDGLPLRAGASCAAGLADIAAFLAGEVDERQVLALARSLMALDWSRWRRAAAPKRASSTPPHALYAVFRLAHLPDGVLRGTDIVPLPIDPEVVVRLAAGDLAHAGAIALRRLRASGLRPVLRHVTGDATLARRLAASLAFPITQHDAGRCADLVTKPYVERPSAGTQEVS